VTRITTEKINDWHPEYNNLQAVVLGNYVMAALTDGDRSIKADPAKIAEAVTEISQEGLVSLAAEGDRLLHAGKGGLSLIPGYRCFSRMDCTFRLLTAAGLPHSGGAETAEGLVLESITQPGHFVTAAPQGTLVLRRIPRGDAATWNLREVKAAIANTSSGMILSAAGGRGITEWSEDGRLQVSPGSIVGPELELSVVSAVGDYPEGAKLLKGDDKTFVIAPIGNLIEERYTPYIEFTGSEVAS